MMIYTWHSGQLKFKRRGPRKTAQQPFIKLFTFILNYNIYIPYRDGSLQAIMPPNSVRRLCNLTPPCPPQPPRLSSLRQVHSLLLLLQIAILAGGLLALYTCRRTAQSFTSIISNPTSDLHFSQLFSYSS
jgi:hypothetical protein